MIWIYLSGWICAATYFVVTARPEAVTFVPPWIARLVLSVVLVGFSSLWPLILAVRLGLYVWHVLGHPGQGRLASRFAAFQRTQQHPLDRCDHEPVEMGKEHDWCVKCGAMRKKPNDWILPMGETIRDSLR